MSGAVRYALDRSMVVPPDKAVRCEWVSIDLCIPRAGPITPEAVEKKYRVLLQQGGAACWPPLIGRREGAHWRILDGAHELLASRMLGRTEVLVATLVDREPHA